MTPEQLFENEFFGHARGAFTDARREQKGLAALADRGTLFLDEVDALSLKSHAKLLRFLQDGTYKRLGGQRFSRARVGVIAATNQDLKSAVNQGSFRSDLYYRLNVLHLTLPPLRERLEDIRLLAAYFFEGRRGADRPLHSLSAASLRRLERHDWPGNVRELFNVLERASVLSDSRIILPRHVVIDSLDQDFGQQASFQSAKARVIENFERTYVEAKLRQGCRLAPTRQARPGSPHPREAGSGSGPRVLGKSPRVPGQRSRYG